MTPGIPSLGDVVRAFNGATTKDTDAESIVSSEKQTCTAEHASDFLGVEGLASGPAVISASVCDPSLDPCCGAIDRGACMQGIAPEVLPATRPSLAAMIAQILVELCK